MKATAPLSTGSSSEMKVAVYHAFGASSPTRTSTSVPGTESPSANPATTGGRGRTLPAISQLTTLSEPMSTSTLVSLGAACTVPSNHAPAAPCLRASHSAPTAQDMGSGTRMGY